MSSENKFCAKCGSPITQDATFCSKCGAPVGAGAPQPPYYYSRRERRRQEKQEKNEKNEKGEKGEKGRGGLIGPIVGGLILVWLGITFYLQESNIISSDSWWAYFVLGIGVILIVQGLLLYVRNRRPIIGPFIGGAILIIIGLSVISNYAYGDLWPLIFVLIGAVIIVSALAGRRRSPAPP